MTFPFEIVNLPDGIGTRKGLRDLPVIEGDEVWCYATSMHWALSGYAEQDVYWIDTVPPFPKIVTFKWQP